MAQKVFVTKAELLRILGPESWSFAMFMASGSQEGTAMRILFENVDDFDLNDSIVKDMLLPLLLQVGAISQSSIDNITSYVNNSLGI